MSENTFVVAIKAVGKGILFYLVIPITLVSLLVVIVHKFDLNFQGGSFLKKSLSQDSPIINPSSGILERALTPGKSTLEDWERFRNAGGIAVDETWRKHWVIKAKVEHNSNTKKLTYMDLDLRVVGLKSMGHELASFDNLKIDLRPECGTEWKILSSQYNSYIASTAEYACAITLSNSDLIGLEVTIK